MRTQPPQHPDARLGGLVADLCVILAVLMLVGSGAAVLVQSLQAWTPAAAPEPVIVRTPVETTS